MLALNTADMIVALEALLATSQSAAYFPGISMGELVCFANSSGDSIFRDCQLSVKAEVNLTTAVDQF